MHQFNGERTPLNQARNNGPQFAISKSNRANGAIILEPLLV